MLYILLQMNTGTLVKDEFVDAKLYVKQHPIECIFFSEFHHKQGPRITYQVTQVYCFFLS